MTDPMYHRNPHLTLLDTEVLEVGEEDGRPFAVLADTLFYPEGGGQPADRGRLGEARVLDVQRMAGAIRHYLDSPVRPGPVQLELDWTRRWDHMQQHTAQHLLTAVALRDFEWRTTAFHLGPEVSDIELDVPSLEQGELDQLEAACAIEIRHGRPVGTREAAVSDFESLGVRSRLLPDGFNGVARLVEIEGLDLNTCGGTHVQSTAEIGVLCLVGTEPMRGGTRVFFVAGDRARRRMKAHEERNRALRSLLDTGDNELPDVVALRMEKEKELAREVRRLTDELAALVAADLAGRPERCVHGYWPEHHMSFLQTVGRRLATTAPEKAGLLAAGEGSDGIFLFVAGPASGIDLAEVGPQIAAALGGRGGGRAPIFQGKAPSMSGREAALEILRSALNS